MLPRLGGPMGRRAAPRGAWFDPRPMIVIAAMVVFLLLFLRHVPCVQTDAGNAINSYIRVCYSDIQTTFLSQGFGQGKSPLGTDTLLFSPLIAVIILLTRKVSSGVFGAPVTRSADLQAQIDSSLTFFALTALGLFICFLIASIAMSYLGRGSGKGVASWDGLTLAAAPIVLASGLISWELVPIAFTLVGLLQFARGRLLESAIILGLAAATGTMAIGFVLAVSVACGLRSGTRGALKFGLTAVATFFVIHLPLLVRNFDAVYAFYHQEINRQTGYGSPWYLASLLGAPLRDTGSLAFMILLVFLGILTAWLYLSRRRPRVGSLVAVVVLAATILGPAYPPQTALWVLVVVILARPYRTELVALTVAEVGYYLAIWGWLGGSLTTAQSGPYLLYWLAIVLRVGVQAWILIECLLDIAKPARDAVRTPDVPDPIGGVLNHAEGMAPVGEPLRAA